MEVFYLSNKSIYEFFTARVDFKSKTEPVLKFIKEFLSQNVETIAGDGFSKRMIFGQAKHDELVAIYGVDKKEWMEFVRNHGQLQYGENMKSITNNLLLIHYLVTRNNDILFFLSIKLFTSKYYRAFPKYIVEPRMKSCINNLNNKFLIKKYGTLNGALNALLQTYKVTYSDRMKTLDDDDIMYLINAVSTRVGIFVRNVQVKYYNTTDAIFQDKEVMDRDNLKTTTNDSIEFENVVQKAYNRELMEGVDMAIWDSLGGFRFRAIFIKFHADNLKTTVHDMLKSILGTYLSSAENPSMETACKDFLKQAMSTYKYDKDLDATVYNYGISKQLNQKDATTFKTLVYRYVVIQIFKTMTKSYHIMRGGR